MVKFSSVFEVKVVEFSMVDTVEFSKVKFSSVFEVTVVKFSMVDMV